MKKEELRSRLFGTWQLVSSVMRREDGEIRDQLGHEPSGFLNYPAEGYVRAVLGARNRPALATNDTGIPTGAEFASEISSFLTSCGLFTVDAFGQAVTHVVEVCLFPNWVGHSENKTVHFVGEQLTLLTDSRRMNTFGKFAPRSAAGQNAEWNNSIDYIHREA
jgi:hypothetical protein